ncbi:hypothetical protein KY284_022641 [Solanum tuberosum]|nr:hypothetical protein KY284_022641 [Solanum tuberosum]
MTDAGYSGDIFTWTNGRRLSKRILIKLVRVMYFDKWSRSFQMVKVRHLPRTDSSPGNLTVADCLDGDHWDMDYISRLLPNNICQIIQSVNIGPRNWKDQAIRTSAHQEILLRKFMNNKGYKMYTNYNWSSICKAMESYKAKLSSKPITWNKPPENIIKVKTDGSSAIQENKAGIGGIARDYKGDITMAFVKSISFCSNNNAETKAASFVSTG